MAILVTGGCGFIGAHVVRRLIRAGHRVAVLDPAPPGLLDELLTPDQLAALPVISGRAENFRDLSAIIRTYAVDQIVHLASLLHPTCDEHPAEAVEANVGGQIAVLEAARLWDIRRTVWTSSVAVFGSPHLQQHLQHPVPLPNDATHRPSSLYGATKSFSEFLARHYREKWDVDIIGLRLTMVYGPGRLRGATAFVNRVLHEVALERNVRVPCADDVLDWQYVEDVAALIERCLAAKRTMTTIFNTRFHIRSVRDFCEYLRLLFPQLKIDCAPGIFGLAWQLDDSALQREIGFVPAYHMERGVLDTINHVRSRHGLPLITLRDK